MGRIGNTALVVGWPYIHVIGSANRGKKLGTKANKCGLPANLLPVIVVRRLQLHPGMVVGELTMREWGRLTESLPEGFKQCW